MSCDVAAAAFLLFAAAGPGGPTIGTTSFAGPMPVSSEPLFQDIIGRAGRLKLEVDGFRKAVGGSPAPLTPPVFSDFGVQIGQPAALDQQGHEFLQARGTDGDLKCILHGISQDMPLKLNAVAAAKTGHDEDLALRDMAYLLNDIVEVITAPPAPPV